LDYPDATTLALIRRLLVRTFRLLLVAIASLLTVTTVAQQPAPAPAATLDPRLEQLGIKYPTVRPAPKP
jgi:hypothetical protein